MLWEWDSNKNCIEKLWVVEGGQGEDIENGETGEWRQLSG